MQNVEDLFPLTPMQRVMLLHSAAATGADALHTQFVYDVRGALDGAAFEGAWQDVAARHPALRTGFLWDELDEPLQFVRKEARVSVETVDRSDVAPQDRQAALDDVVAEDRARGFDLGKAPLTRATLVHWGDDGASLLWSSHHLVLDRWCTAEVLGDLARFYSARAAGSPPVVRPGGRFRDYVAWIMARDVGAGIDFWRRELAGVADAGRSVAGDGRSEVDSESIELDDALAQRLRGASRSLRVSPSTVVQAAWALVVAERTGRPDVVFGATVTGRPAELPGVESIVGSFVSNVPVRVSIDADSTVAEWVGAIQRRQQERAPFESMSAADIHAASGLPSTEPLFDSLLIWLAPVEWESPDGIELVPRRGGVTTTFPLTLSVEDRGGGIGATLERVAGDATPRELLDALVRWIEVLIGDPDARLGAIDGVVAGETPTPTPDTAPLASARVGASCGAEGPIARGREEEELEMVEQTVLAEARAVLGHDEVRPTDSFFEVGGNSLRAAALHVQLERVLGRSVPILQLFRAPTLRDMARFLAEREWPVTGDMVRPIHAQGTRTPLFCLSSPEVNSLGYVLLARHLDPDQPVMLVQSPPAADDVQRVAITQIPTFAERYVEAIRAERPSGPYRLLGMCDGALIALEAAKRLREQGEEVEFFGVLNTHSLNTLSWRNRIRRVEMRMHYYLGRIGDMRRLTWSQRRTEVDRVLRARVGALTARSDAAAGEELANGDAASTTNGAHESTVGDGRYTDEAIHREWQELDWPDRHLPASKYPGTVTVFRIRRQPYFRIRDEDLGWSRHADHVDVVQLETEAQLSPARDRREWRESHLDILREPDVRRTAATVMRSLDALEGESTA